MKVLKDDEEVVITGKELAKHRDVCRKEGAIKELVDLHHYICSDININEKDLLKFINKRLKVLGGKV